jgi:Fe-S cluster assembly protein SufB/Fe-S cluster assembly protein SufD
MVHAELSQIVLQGLSAHSVAELSERLDEPSWLREFRLKAYEQFEKLPVEQSSLYSKYVDLRGVDFSSINLQPQSGKRAPAEFVESIRKSRKGHTQVQLDSATTEAELPADLKAIGVRFGNIVTAIREDPEFFRPYFLEKAIMPHEDKLAALNCALFTNGVFLYVPKGIAVSLPFRNVSALNEPRGSAISHAVVIADAASQVTLLDELYTTDESTRQPSLHSSIVEIYAHDGAEAKYGGINALGDEKISLTNKRSIGERDSRVSWAIGYFGGKLTKSKIDMILKGTGASADDNEIVFGSNSEHFDITTNILHKGTNTSGQAHGKCVLKEKSRAIMKGLIIIDENAKNSNAYLAEHAMLLSPDARADAIPGLEIACNEVKATHSASVAQVNEEQVFYLLTRGLSEAEAKKMLIGGFFEPVMRQVGILEVRGRIRALVDKKWENQPIGDIATRDVGAEIEQELEVFEGRKDIFEGHYKYR